MKQVYRAFDGTIFDSKNDCIEYERTHANFVMYDASGEITSDVGNAIFVYLPYEGYDEANDVNPNAQAFMAASDEAGFEATGIIESDAGLFIWDEWHENYTYLDRDMLPAIAKIDHDIAIKYPNR